MYPVSDGYKRAIRDYNRVVKVEGTLTLKNGIVVTIDDSDIVQGSLYVQNQCVSGEGLDPGSVYVGEMGLSLISRSSLKPNHVKDMTWAESEFSWRDAFLQWAGSADGVRWAEADISWQDADFAWSSDQIDPYEKLYTLNGAKIELRFGLLVDDVDDTWEYVPLGIYTVVETQRKIGIIHLRAYDRMIEFDKPVGYLSATGNAYYYLSEAAFAAGVPFALTPAQVAAMPNGGRYLHYNPSDEIATYRDLISWVAQVLGCYATITRDGKLTLKSYLGEPVRAINPDERESTTIEDFELGVTGVTMTVSGAEYAATSGSGGVTIELEENPLLRTYTPININGVLSSLLNHWQGVAYTPCECNFLGDPALDVGDYITLIGGTAGYAPGRRCLITHTNWKYRAGHSIRSAGKPGTVSVTKTQTQKKVEKAVSLGTSYYGTTITAKDGLVVEKVDSSGDVVARAIFNSDVIAMQVYVNGDWVDCLYFDAVNRTYTLNGKLLTGAEGEARTVIDQNGIQSYDEGDVKAGLWCNEATSDNLRFADLTLYRNNSEVFKVYNELSSIALKAFGSSFLVSTGPTTTAEGTWNFSSATAVNGLNTDSAGTHNHGIPNGAKLALTDGSGQITGYVEFTESGAHVHNVKKA